MNINSTRPEPCVLVVDDHEISRKHIVKALRQVPCHVKQARNGREAADQARRLLPELIFLDLHLPDTRGSVLLKRIRKYWPEDKPKPVFIIISGHVSGQALIDLRLADVSVVLLKPVTAREIRDIANQNLPWQPGIRENPSPCESRAPDSSLQRIFLCELKVRLPELDGRICDLDWDAARAIVHQLLASSAICREQLVEHHCRCLHRNLSKEPQARKIAQAYYGLLQAVGQSKLWLQT